MLNRMRDLAVQSANTATNDSAARTAARLRSPSCQGGDRPHHGLDQVRPAGAARRLLRHAGRGRRPASTPPATYTVAAGSDFDINVERHRRRHGRTSSAGTYTGSQLARIMQTAIKTALTRPARPLSRRWPTKITVESTTVGAGFSLIDQGRARRHRDASHSPTAPAPRWPTSPGRRRDGCGRHRWRVPGRRQHRRHHRRRASLGLSATGLGIASLDIVTDAGTAITGLDAAITTVSTTRGNLGAVQNRFESTIANLQVATENLSASESRIRDTDMAAEMDELHPHQILQQAGTAMLARPTAAPQSVLRLLNG